MDSPIRPLLPVLCLVLLAGCAVQPPAKPDPRDPWERMNRVSYKFNDKLDKAILRPVARTYRNDTPRVVQTGIRNVFDNVDTTIVMVNDLLQGQFKPFLNDTVRLLMNTTIGIGGLFDPATRAGLDKNSRDFGQTLGKWGLQPGPYLVLPFLGPSDVRDAFGKLADTYSTPRTYIDNRYWNYGSYLLEKLDERARLLDYDRTLDSAYDPYAFLRSAYLQNRDFKVNGSRSPSEEEQEEQLLNEAGAEEQAPPLKPQTPQPQKPQPQTPQPQAPLPQTSTPPH
ncbi:MAG: VacJ family lipoprotein [Steroidobacteraceae bacterium]